MIDDKKATTIKKRQETLKRKAYELQTLCGVDVCLICYDSQGKLETWPEERNRVTDILTRHKYANAREGSKRRKVNMEEFVRTQKIEFCDKNESYFGKKFPSWDKRLDGYSKEKLTELQKVLEIKLQSLTERLQVLAARMEEKMVGVGDSRDHCILQHEEGGCSVGDHISENDESHPLPRLPKEYCVPPQFAAHNMYPMPTEFSVPAGNMEAWPSTIYQRERIPANHIMGNDSDYVPSGHLQLLQHEEGTCSVDHLFYENDESYLLSRLSKECAPQFRSHHTYYPMPTDLLAPANMEAGLSSVHHHPERMPANNIISNNLNLLPMKNPELLEHIEEGSCSEESYPSSCLSEECTPQFPAHHTYPMPTGLLAPVSTEAWHSSIYHPDGSIPAGNTMSNTNHMLTVNLQQLPSPPVTRRGCYDPNRSNDWFMELPMPPAAYQNPTHG